MFNPKQILVPTDFSASSRAALEDAAAIAKTYGALLDVIHVWEIPTFTAVGDMAAGFSVPSTVIDAVSAQAHAMMEHFLQDARAQGFAIRIGRVIPGSPYRAIVDAAKDDEYDLIVIGTHGRQKLARVLLGSVAERVIRHAPCAVLVSRAKSNDDTAPAETT
jgi:universal stress protein A